ncbi:MAG: hypothetical protein KF775_07190 [Cyclobacteriaceae bacterium]|nr:hypothetical protein [Cyclobacteriaceae bacterium]
MFVPFEELPPDSRVWIYTGSRAFTDTETQTIHSMLQAFCEQWTTHGQPLKSSFALFDNQFVVIAVNESYQNPSGCSIDSSVGVVRHIQDATGINLLDRGRVPFYINTRIELIPLAHLKIQFQQGILHPDTLTFNTLAVSKSQLEPWKIPAKNTWLAKYLPTPAVIQ